MKRLPTVIVTSVIRSSHQGESHGGAFLVDLETGTHQQVIDWNTSAISWEGRGADRGLRGIAVSGKEIYLAASDELFVYDFEFELLDSFRNRYLRHSHEVFAHDSTLYLTSTGYDSVLVFDMKSKTFEKGLSFRAGRVSKLLRDHRYGVLPSMQVFDPNADGGPTPADTRHINNVHWEDDTLFVAGTHLPYLLAVSDFEVSAYAPIPIISHNARPFRGGVLLNDTASDRVVMLKRNGKLLRSFPIEHYDRKELMNPDLPEDLARQAFGRGLIVFDDRFLIAGSSPATVSVYDVEGGEVVQRVNLTMDVRNAVHGLELWPL